ncbi:hypothetical protein [Ferrimonas senticii]|uniref:hypothetical protein n=1 Tax=Ferrimonas senticii TaxID=394566 RepID=UPI000420DE44|nr:hypothetical protein [Ferrimonas senticii]
MANELLRLFIYRWLCHLWQWRRWLWLPPLLLASLALVRGELVDKRYRSTTVLLLQESALANPFLKDLSVAVQLKERLSGLTALLRSRQLLQQVAEDARLVGPDQSLPEWRRAQLAQAVSLQTLGDSLVRLSVVWTSPEQAQQLLAAFSQRFQQRLMAPGQRAVDESSQFLQKQLQQQEQSLNQVEQQLAAFKQQNAALLPDLLSSNNLALLEAETAIRQQKIAIEGAQSRLQSLTSQLATTNPLIGELEQRIISVQTELAQLKGRYTGRHSAVKAVSARLSQLQQEKQRLLQQPQFPLAEHLDNLWQLATTLSAEEGQTPILVSQLKQMQQAQSQFDGLSAELALLEQHRQGIVERMRDSAAVAQRLNELERLADGRRQLYQELLLRFEKARVTSELGQFEAPTKVQIIDAPSLPGSSIDLPWFINLLLGAAGGLISVLSLVTLSSLLDRRIYAPAQIQRLLSETGEP